MSKSSGNGIDPLDMIDKFGTDAGPLEPGDRHCPRHGLPPLRGENRRIPQLRQQNLERLPLCPDEHSGKRIPQKIRPGPDQNPGRQMDRFTAAKTDHGSRLRPGEFPFFRSRDRRFTTSPGASTATGTLKCPKATRPANPLIHKPKMQPVSRKHPRSGPDQTANEHMNPPVLLYVLKTLLTLLHPFVPFVTADDLDAS